MVRKISFLVALVVCIGIPISVQAELVGRWKLDDAVEDGVIKDSSGKDNHGQIEGSPTSISGIMGKAMELHGQGAANFGGDRIICPHSATLDITEAMTLALWIRPDAIDPESKGTNGGEIAPLAKAHKDRSPAWSWQVRYGWRAPEPYMGFQFNASPGGWVFVNRNLERFEWVHIACTLDGETAICYLDGEETDSTDIGEIVSSETPVVIGSDGWGSDWIGGLDDVRIYDHALTPSEVEGLLIDERLSSNPNPAHEAENVLRDVTLTWSPGVLAATHNLYLGENLDAVNDASTMDTSGVLLSESLDANSYSPGRLSFDTTYYWRVDEVNAPPNPGIHKGSIWSFTTEPEAYAVTPIAADASSVFIPSMAPEKTIDGSGLDDANLHDTGQSNMWLSAGSDTDPWIQYEFSQPQKLDEMWIWNSNQSIEGFVGFGTKEVTIETSEDGSVWTPLEGVPEFARAPGSVGYSHNTVVDFGGVRARYVKLSIHDTWGTVSNQAGLSEVRFFAIPVYAAQPQPKVGAKDQRVLLDLTWRPGRDNAKSELFLGTDPEALSLVGQSQDSRLNVSLDLDQTYFWRIDEVNESETTKRWVGETWQFSTALYIVIDDMELYKDAEFKEIWATWADGYNDSTNGAVVGNGSTGAPEAEIVYDSHQSMPYRYGQDGIAISETTREFMPPMDWSLHGVQSLSLMFYGDPANTPGQLYVRINGKRVADYPGPTADMTQAQWQRWQIDLVALGITNVDSLTLGVQGGEGTIFVDAIRLYPTMDLTPPVIP